MSQKFPTKSSIVNLLLTLWTPRVSAFYCLQAMRKIVSVVVAHSRVAIKSYKTEILLFLLHSLGIAHIFRHEE